MENNLRKLTDEETDEIRNKFLTSFGNNVRNAREKLNIPQSELAGAIGLPGAALSYSENGVRDMKISNLPLIGIYCRKRMQELLPVEMDAFLEAFNGNVGFVIRKYQRDAVRQKKEQGKVLTAKVYTKNGERFEEKVVHREKKPDPKDEYRKCLITPAAKPFTDKEFLEYAIKKYPEMSCLLPSLYEIEIQMDVQNGYIRTGLPEFFLDRLIIDDIVKEPRDEKVQRAYAYYYGIYKAVYSEEIQMVERETGSDGNSSPDETADKDGQMSLFDFLGDENEDGNGK